MIALETIGFSLVVIAFVAATVLFLMGGPNYRRRLRPCRRPRRKARPPRDVLTRLTALRPVPSSRPGSRGLATPSPALSSVEDVPPGSFAAGRYPLHRLPPPPWIRSRQAALSDPAGNSEQALVAPRPPMFCGSGRP